MDYIFDVPLVEGIIEKRKSQFTMIVTVDGQIGVSCHCPTNGRVGNLDLADCPCLLSQTGKRLIPWRQRHVAELAGSLKEHERAILLVCFIYDNPGFQIIERSTNYEEVKATVDSSISMGVETWQTNFEITPAGVALKKYFSIHIE